MLLAIEKTQVTRTKALELAQEHKEPTAKDTVHKTLTQQILAAHLTHKEASIDSLLCHTKERLQNHLNLLQQQERTFERSLSVSRDMERGR